MRSLFVKIFLFFWLAMTLIGALFAVIYLSSTPTWVHGRRIAFVRRAIRSHGADLVRHLRAGDARAAEKAVRDLEDQSDVRVHLFHGEAHRAGLTAPSAEVRALAREAARKGATVRRWTTKVDRYAVPLRKEGFDGWVIVGELHHGPRLLSYLQPETLALRMLVIFLVAGLICYVLARYITRPIQSLGRATRKFAAGDLSARAGPVIGRRRDETGELGQDFDRMADRIQSLIDAQRRLLRDISHEVRSPLARLHVALGLARKKAGEDAGAALDRIEKEADRINELIGQLTTLTRLEDSTETTERVPIDLAALVREVVRDTSFEFQPSQRAVELLREASITIHGTPELIRRAVENVVRNGVQFTALDTVVEVSLDRESSTTGPVARIQVRDHGPGVPPANLDDIFRPFFRVAKARDRRSGGVGVGLAISQRAVLHHGGSIRAQNASGGGLLVVIELPLTEPDASGSARS